MTHRDIFKGFARKTVSLILPILLITSTVGGIFAFGPNHAQAAGTITRVAGQATGKSVAGASTTLAFPASVTAGNTIVVATTVYQGSGSTTVTKSTGTATLSAFTADKTFIGGSHELSIWRASVTTSGTLTVSVAKSSAAFIFVSINEYNGFAASPVDGTPDSNTATSTSEATHALTTTGAGMILMISTENSTANFTYTQSDTNIYKNSTGSSQYTAEAQDKITAGAGSYTMTAATANSWTWYSVAVAYKASTGTGDVTAPTTPIGLGATAVSSSQINLSWTASTDDTAVTGYKVFRNGTQVGTPSTTSYSDTGLTASTTYTYTVSANDAAGNNSAQSASAQATTQAAAGDTTAPTVSMTAPANGALVFGSTTTVSATATDNVGVIGVQFLLDGANLAAEDTTSPYSTTWNTTTASAGSHTVSARARDAAGNSTTAANTNVTVDNQAPTGSILINGGAAATNSTAATLTLSATDGQSPVTQMRFSNTGTSFNTAVAYATSAAWTLTTGVGTKTVYVQFKDTAGNWSGSFTDTIVLDTTAPTISGFGLTNVTSTSTTVVWTTNEPATSQVDYGITTSYNQTTPIDNTLVTSHSVMVSGLTPSTMYNYRARSKDAAGNEKLSSNASAQTLSGPDTTPPTVPTNLTANATSSSQINLTWSASTDNVGVTGYRIYRDGSPIATTSSVSYQDSGLNPSTSYSYAVEAFDSLSNTSAQSSPAAATTFVPPDTTAPTAPTGVNASAVSETQINLTWIASTDDTAVTGYKIFRNQSQIATSATTSFSDTSLAPQTSYVYNVSAYDAAGNNSAQSSSANTSTLADTTPPTIDISSPVNNATISGTVLIITSNVADNIGVAGVTFYVDSAPIGSEDIVSPYTTNLDTTPLTNGNHVLTAVARDTSNNTATSTPVTIVVSNDTTAPSVPTNLASSNVTSTSATVSWTASTDNVGVTGYKVFRNGVQITTTASTSFADSGLTANTSYTYTVLAYDAAGNNSAQSSGLVVTTLVSTGRTYTTNFSAAENPISESGNWLNGQTNGLDWGDVRMTVGQSYGVSLPSTYGDPTAIVTGAWTPDQQAQATVKINSAQGSCCHEVELRLRTTITPHSITGYEILCSVVPSSGYGIQIVRWNGPLSSFDYINESTTKCANNDVLKAKIIGNTITVYINNVQIIQGTDSTFTSGAPGLGFYDNNDSNWSSFGFSSFTAQDASASSDTIAPSVPTNLVATAVSQSQINLTWTASTDNVGVTGYKIYRSGTQIGTTATNSYSNTGLTASTLYSYTVSAYDAALNNSAQSSSASATTQAPPPDTTAPSVPTNLAATAVSTSQINLTWTASTDNVGVTGYKVFRAGVQVATTATNSYSDTGLTVATLYSYNVSAYDAAANNSAQSSSASATTFAAPDTTAPSVPTNLVATAVSASQVNLTWTASTDNVAVTGYKVFRNGTQVGTPSTNSYSDTGLTASTTYAYTVSANDAAGNNSAQSTSAQATTNAPSSTVISAVTGQNKGEVGSSSLASLAYTNAVTIGNQVIVTVQAYKSGSAPVINTPTKAAGTSVIGVFTKDASYTNNSGTDYMRVDVYRAPVTTGGTLTIGFSGTWSFGLSAINEFAGMSASPVDGVAVTNSGTSVTESTGNLTTSATGGMVLMSSTELSSASFTYTLNGTSIYNNGQGNSNFTGEAQYKLMPSAGTIALTAGTAHSWFWISVGVAYKAGP